MSKIITLIFIISLWTNNIIQAQRIEDIKKASNNNSNSGDNNSSSGCTDGLFEGCFEVLFSELFTSCFEVGCSSLWETLFYSDLTPEEKEEDRLWKQTQRKNGEIPPFASLEVFGNFGFIPNTDLNIRPRIRGRVGRFALDYRLNYLREERLYDVDIYTTHDLGLNFYIVNHNELTWRIGTGFMTETYLNDVDLSSNQEAQNVSNTYQEFVTGFDIYVAPKIRISPEFRWAQDWDTDTRARLETNLTFNYALVETNGFRLELNTHILYAKYFQAVDIWNTGFGLALKFD